MNRPFTTPKPSLRLELQQNRDVLTIGEVIDFATKASLEAYREVTAGGASHEAAFVAARLAYRANMPMLESRSAAQAYIGTITRGMELEFISNGEAKQMIWAARLWLIADGKKKESVRAVSA
jgi:hypothetical protein